MPPKKILLIDREKNSRQALARLLRDDGYWVESLSSIVQALRRIEHEPFDLIITDMGIPYKGPKQRDGVGGLPHSIRWQVVVSLLRVLQRGELSIPLIVIEARDEVRDYLKAVKFGAYEYLNKPIDYEDLKRKIELALTRTASLVVSP
jgi:CheY-like chemotaxis protein